MNTSPTRYSITLRLIALAPLVGTMLLLGLVRTPARAERTPLPPRLQEKVNDAVDLGVSFLKDAQLGDGCWVKDNEGYRVANAALPALTLLECGVAKSDVKVQRAAAFVRQNSLDLDGTYELALGILFLNRLDEPRDKKLIQMLAMRLVAGQSATGGWGYKCPKIDPVVQRDLMKILAALNPRPAPAGGAAGGNKPGPGGGVGGAPDKKPDVGPGAGGPSSSPGSSPGSSSSPPSPPAKEAPGAQPKPDVAPAPPDKGAPKPAPADKPGAKLEPKPKKVFIPANLQVLPVLQDPKKHDLANAEAKVQGVQPINTPTDNSNTQFAALALAVAQRHDLTLDRCYQLLQRRFETSQNTAGAWDYSYAFGGGGESPQMDCCGLIGLAVARGADTDDKAKRLADPKVTAALTALGKHIGKPTGKWKDLRLSNLYFLWSLERVGVIYDLPKIGGNDWYQWVAEMLVANQQPLGNWAGGGYPGATPILDTSMALLILKKANIVKDLAGKVGPTGEDLEKVVDKKVEPPSGGTTTPPVKVEPPVTTPVAPPPVDPPTPPVEKPPEKPVAVTPTPPPAPAPAPAPTPASSKTWLWVTLGAGAAVLLTVMGLLIWKLRSSSPATDVEEEAADDAPRKKAPKGKTAKKTSGAKAPASNGKKAVKPTPSGEAASKVKKGPVEVEPIAEDGASAEED